jgi:hypothetical protein
MQGGLPSCLTVYHAASVELCQMLDGMAAVLMHCAKPFCQLRRIAYEEHTKITADLMLACTDSLAELRDLSLEFVEHRAISSAKWPRCTRCSLGSLVGRSFVHHLFARNATRITRYSLPMLFIWVRVARSRRHHGTIKATVVDYLLDTIQAGSEENQKAISYSFLDSGCYWNVSS